MGMRLHVKLWVLVFLAAPVLTNDVVLVATGRAFAQALANESISTAIVTRDIVIAADDFGGGFVVLRRRFVVSGMDGPMPVLDLNYLTQKVQLLRGGALVFRHLVIDRFRRGKMLTNFPGLDLLTPSPPGHDVLVQVEDARVITRFCFPLWLRDQNYAGLVRAAGHPGPNLLQRSVSQAGCVNDSTATPLTRCYADVGAYIDVAVEGFDADVHGAKVPTNYALWIFNSSFLCQVVLSEACIRTYSPAGCLLLMNGQQQPPPPPAPPQADGGGGRWGADEMLAPVLAGVLGGAGLLAVLAVGLVLLRRRRRPGAAQGGHQCAPHKPPLVQLSLAGQEVPPPAWSSSSAALGNMHTMDSATAAMLVSPLTLPRSNLDLGLGTSGSGGDDDGGGGSGSGGGGGGGGGGDGSSLTLLPRPALGAGSFGRVVAGVYGGAEVAVKLIGGAGLASPLDADPRCLAALVQEVEVLARCAHPNIVRLLAANLAPPRPCLVMEMMEMSLDRLLYGTPGALLPLGKVLYIAEQIASGLAYLHPFLLHRDLKPANVLLSGAAGDRPTVKLSDFGLSRLRSSVLITANGEAGTPAYMAPECFDPVDQPTAGGGGRASSSTMTGGGQAITHKADIYGLGVMLAEMLAGRPPWAGEGMVRIAASVRLRGLRPALLESLPPARCPGKLARLVRACWEGDPARRPAAAEVVKELMLVGERLSLQRAGGGGDMDVLLL